MSEETGMDAIMTAINPHKPSFPNENRMENDDIFSFFFDHSSIGMSITHVSGKMCANQAFHDMLGYTKDEFDNLAIPDITHPDDVALSQKKMASLLSGNSLSERFVKRYIHKNGAHVWADINTVLRRDISGNPLYFITTISDITEKIRSRETLSNELLISQQRQEILSRISMSAAVSSGNLAELMVVLSEGASRIAGVERVGVWLLDETESQLRCINLYEASLKRHSSGAVLDRHEYENEFRALFEAGYMDAHDALTDPRTSGYLETYIRPFGITSMLDAVIRVSGRNLGVLCFEHVAHTHHWTSDEIDFVCRLADQIALTILNSERNLADAKLRESEAKFSMAFQTSPYALTITRARDGQFIDVNHAFTTITGYTRKETLASTSLGLNLWKDKSERDRVISMLAEAGSIVNHETRFTGKDGRSIDGLFSAGTFSFQNETCILSSINDITGHKKTESALHAKSRTLEKVFESAPYIMMILDEKERLIDINRAGILFFGRPKEELADLLCGEVFECVNSFSGQGCGKNEPCQSCPVRSRVIHTFKTGEALQHGAGCLKICRNGLTTDRDILVSTTLLDTPNGRQVLVTLVDNTDQKRNNEQLTIMAQMLDNAPALITVHDTSGQFLYANQAAVDHHGYDDTAQFLSINLHDLDVPESEALLQERFRSIFEKGHACFEVSHFHRNGSTFPLEVLAKTIEWHGKPAVLSIASDISVRKQVEWHRSRQLLFSSALNRTAGMIISTDSPDDMLDNINRIIGESLQVDRSLIYRISFQENRITGMSEWLRTEDDPLIVPTKERYSSLKMFESAFNAIRNTGQYLESHVDAVNRHFLGDGSGDILHHRLHIKSLIWFPFAFDENGYYLFTINRILEQKPWSSDELDFLVAVAKQVSLALMKIGLIEKRQAAESERERLQEQLTQAQKMESVGRLAGGVAHDFNNMLGIIMGHTEMAMARMEPSEPVFGALQEIHKAAARSADLTRQLLAFARRQVVAPRVIDLNDSVESMIKMLRRLIGEDIDLIWLPSRNIGTVRIDPTQIDQIMANLCVNARDAINGVGKVIIETENRTLDDMYCRKHVGFVPGDYVTLSFSDTGSGMNRQILANIFEPFFTTKEMGKGTGLGLAMVYGIVKQNNGFINVYSEPGHGTTFKIHLPCHVGDAVPIPVDRVIKPAQGGNETLLIVEDEPSILEITQMMLERLGYRILTAASPNLAIDIARDHDGIISLLMTDVIMPGMNGPDLAKKLQTLHPHMKCLFMSGYTANVIAHQGVLDSGINFIQKPFSMKDLAIKVRETLGTGK